MNKQATPSIASNDIIIKITCQELIELGYYMGDYLPQDEFNLHINISKEQIKIAPDVDGADFDNSFEFDYVETMADLNLGGHLANGINVGALITSIMTFSPRRQGLPSYGKSHSFAECLMTK